VIISIIWRF